MLRSQVRRTLIKSPLELWEELSDPAALARHLGEFGDIRVTRAQEERELEWEAETISGTIELSPSGWGTRVTLTVSAPEAEGPEASEAVFEPGADGTAEPGADEPPAALARQAPMQAAEPVAEASATLESEAILPENEAILPESTPEPEPVRGLFARVLARFSRRREPAQDTVPADEPVLGGSLEERGPALELEAAPLADALVAAGEPEPAPARESAPAPFAPLAQRGLHPEIWLEEIEALDLRASARRETAVETDEPEPVAERTLSDDQAEAVLVAVLDRLGSAHHRPFSRG